MIADGWDLFLDDRDRGLTLSGVTEGTLKRYRAVRTHHLNFCADGRISSWNVFSDADLTAYSKRRDGDNAAPRTIRLELELIKSVMKFLISARRLPESCRLQHRVVQMQGTDTYCYSVEEVRAMVEHCRAIPGLTWLGDLIVGLACTGMRIGEAAALQWRDINLSAKTIRIADERGSRRKGQSGAARTTKGKRSRVIPISQELLPLLQSVSVKGGLVFHAAKGGQLRSRNVLAQFIKHVIEPLKTRFPLPEGEAIGFEHGRLHSFRHFFCSQAFVGGANVGEIQDWLGHADSDTVQHYRHLRDEDARRRMDSLTFLGSDDQNGEQTGIVAIKREVANREGVATAEKRERGQSLVSVVVPVTGTTHRTMTQTLENVVL